MARLKKVLGIFLIVIGPTLIYAISSAAFRKAAEYEGLKDAFPWLLLSTLSIPAGMAVAVIGFLYMKGER